MDRKLAVTTRADRTVRNLRTASWLRTRSRCVWPLFHLTRCVRARAWINLRQPRSHRIADLGVVGKSPLVRIMAGPCASRKGAQAGTTVRVTSYLSNIEIRRKRCRGHATATLDEARTTSAEILEVIRVHGLVQDNRTPLGSCRVLSILCLTQSWSDCLFKKGRFFTSLR